MAWIFLIFAGIFEVVGVSGMNQINRERTFKSFFVLFMGFGISFSLLSLAMESLSMGLSYAVWTGIGTIGGAIVGMMFYGEAKDWKRLMFIGMILLAVIGLKLTH